MKKLYTILSLAVVAFTANAANHIVAIGLNCSTGAPANVFCPAATTAVVGDSVTFILGSPTHNVTSTSVPGGAATISSGTMSTPGQQYVYVITVAGSYSYMCTIHGASMSGTINATASGIIDPIADIATTAYPSPFKDKFTVKYGNQITSMKIFNVIGEEVKSIELASGTSKTEVDFEGIPAGIYFIRTYNDATIVETKKIVKAK